MMIKKIDRTAEITRELEALGRVKVLNEPHHVAATLDLNKQMEKVRREYKRKSAESEESAKNFYI